MVVSVEKFQKENNAIQRELATLKAITTSSEKMKKKSELDARIQKVKKELLDEYQKESDKNTREKISMEKDKLEAFSEELNTLSTEVTTNTDSSDQNTAHSVAEEKSSTEKKKVFDTVKDFVSEQRSDVWNKEKWKEEGGKNALRTAGFFATGVGAVALAYKGIKALFGSHSSEQEESDETEETPKKKKKKGFWKTAFGKVLKRTGVAAGVGTLGYYFGKLFGKETKATDTDTDQEKIQSYEAFYNDEANQEKVKNYEEIGENVDVVYEALYNRELEAGYQDELEMSRIVKQQSVGTKHYKGIVPFCLDNKFGTVQAVLEQNTSLSNALRGGITTMKSYIKGMGLEWMKSFADSYLSKFPSWIPYVGKGGSLFDDLDRWVLKHKDAEKELAFFFRQSIRIQTYLFEKRDQLRQKVVERIATETGKGVEEVFEDKQLWETDQQYQTFLSSSLADSAIVLRNNMILDAHIGEKVKQSVMVLDQERDEILSRKEGEKDILHIIAQKRQKGEQLDEKELQTLISSCDALAKDIDSKILDAVEESARNVYGDLLGTNDSALRTYMDQSKLKEVFMKCKKTILDEKVKLQNGQVDLERIGDLGETLNTLLALKKEALLGRTTIEQDVDENGNIIYRIPGFLRDSLGNMVKAVHKLAGGEIIDGASYLFASAGVSITVIGGVLRLCGAKKLGGQVATNGVKIGLAPATFLHWVGKQTLSRTVWGARLADKVQYGSPQWIQLMTTFKGEKGGEAVIEALKSGKITLEDAEALVKRRCFRIGTKKNVRDAWRSTFEIASDIDEAKVVVQNKIFDKFVQSYQASGVDFLRKIKSKPGLYEQCVKYFDPSSELREAIRNDVSLDTLEEMMVDIEKKLSFGLPKLPHNVGNNADNLLDLFQKKSIYNDLAEHRKILHTELDPLQLQTHLSGVDKARYNKLTSQIAELDAFEKQLLANGEGMMDQTSELLMLLKKGGNLNVAIDQLTTLKKLEGETFFSNIIDPKTGKSIEQSLDDVIKNLDDTMILSLKGKKISGVSDEALEMLATTFTTIKVAKNTKSLFTNADELLTGVKTMIKIFAKMT